MKKLLIIAFTLAFVACSQTSSNFTYLPMPNFKNHTNDTNLRPSSGKKVSLRLIDLRRNEAVSQGFKDSVLKARIDEETRLLIQKLEAQSKQILAYKGYEVVQSGADYELLHSITLDLRELNAQKSEQWLKEEAINSSLELNLYSTITLQSLRKSSQTRQINTATALDQPVKITYASKDGKGVNFFKTTLSSVPTQVNKELSLAAVDIDNAFLSFYNGVLNNLVANLSNDLAGSNHINPASNALSNTPEESLEPLNFSTSQDLNKATSPNQPLQNLSQPQFQNLQTAPQENSQETQQENSQNNQGVTIF